MSKNQQENDEIRKNREKIENRSSKFEKQLGNDEPALTRKEIMEARSRDAR